LYTIFIKIYKLEIKPNIFSGKIRYGFGVRYGRNKNMRILSLLKSGSKIKNKTITKRIGVH
ncbi:MAG: hypothetical protein ACFNKL_08260, partial [Treponema sp.]